MAAPRATSRPLNPAPGPADGRMVARVLRLSLCGMLAVLLGLVAWIGLVRAGVLPDPFGPQASGDLALARSNRGGLRVLFVGNSLTFRNAMPELVSRLAAGDPGAPPVYAVWYTVTPTSSPPTARKAPTGRPSWRGSTTSAA